MLLCELSACGYLITENIIFLNEYSQCLSQKPVGSKCVCLPWLFPAPLVYVSVLFQPYAVLITTVLTYILQSGSYNVSQFIGEVNMTTNKYVYTHTYTHIHKNYKLAFGSFVKNVIFILDDWDDSVGQFGKVAIVIALPLVICECWVTSHI